jgi:hypothetical protein
MDIFTYKARVKGIEVVELSEHDTSKTVTSAVEKTTVSALNAVCPSAGSVMRHSTLT